MNFEHLLQMFYNPPSLRSGRQVVPRYLSDGALAHVWPAHRSFSVEGPVRQNFSAGGVCGTVYSLTSNLIGHDSLHLSTAL